MPFYGEDSYEAEAYRTVQAAPHKAHLSHELLAAAAAYQAAKAWQEHQAKNGHPGSHDKAKRYIAAASAAFITRLAETKGADAIESHKAKKAAEDNLSAAYDKKGYKC